MLFNSIHFLLFFPIVLLIYQIVPDRVKYLWLLAASYYFYMSWNARYALLILLSTAITYVSGLLLERENPRETGDTAPATPDAKRAAEATPDTGRAAAHLTHSTRRKLIVAASFTLNLAILFYYKYFNFALRLVARVLAFAGISLNVPVFDIMLPVGISFYTFQALSYTMDVYRGEIYAEKNFFRYALFVSFFPQLVAGPIERSKNLLKQLAVPHKLKLANMREGLLLMLWGYFLKIVLADRIAVFVDHVYGNYQDFGGCYLIAATVLFAVQIYCDFAGYSTIAMGAALFLGVRLMENFNAPYLSTSVAEFWRKWHISLTSWFRDYLYFPLGGSRKGKARKYLNKLIVFLVSGLWHGASLSFVAWGGLNGLYQIAGEILTPARQRLAGVLHIDRESLGFKLAQTALTFVFVDFAWIFFRADSLRDSVKIVLSIAKIHNPWIFWNGTLYECGLDQRNFLLMLCGIGLLLFADFWKRRGVVIREVIMRQDYWVRCVVIDAAVVALLVWGMWGSTYDTANFIYFQF